MIKTKWRFFLYRKTVDKNLNCTILLYAIWLQCVYFVTRYYFEKRAPQILGVITDPHGVYREIKNYSQNDYYDTVLLRIKLATRKRKLIRCIKNVSIFIKIRIFFLIFKSSRNNKYINNKDDKLQIIFFSSYWRNDWITNLE